MSVAPAPKRWPMVGDRLVHRFRRRSGEVVGHVLSIDQTSGRISVRVGKKVYGSLSAAATDVMGHEVNGWIFWGLKKPKVYPAKDR